MGWFLYGRDLTLERVNESVKGSFILKLQIVINCCDIKEGSCEAKLLLIIQNLTLPRYLSNNWQKPAPSNSGQIMIKLSCKIPCIAATLLVDSCFRTIFCGTT